MKPLLAYDGPLSALGAPERFLCIMARVPRLLDKVNLLILRSTFQACFLPCAYWQPKAEALQVMSH